MALVTFLAFANATSVEVVMPADATLATREFVAVGFGNTLAAGAVRMELAIANCKTDVAGATFTARFSQPAATSSGFFNTLPVGTFLARADQLTTLTGTTSAAITGTMMVCYNQIPLGGSDNWTARV